MIEPAHFADLSCLEPISGIVTIRVSGVSPVLSPLGYGLRAWFKDVRFGKKEPGIGDSGDAIYTGIMYTGIM